MKISTSVAAVAALALAGGSAVAQTTATNPAPATSRAQDRLNTILGTLFGTRAGATDSIEAQWAAGQFPLATQRAQFESRIDADVRSGTLNQTTGSRLKTDYTSLVQLEARYGADRRFTTQERSDLADRYGALTQVLSEGGYADTAAAGDGSAAATVSDGQGEFSRRVDAQVGARRLTRTEGTRLRTDYAALVQVEAGYLRDGVLSSREREDLDGRLDALDVRVGDVAYQGGAPAATPRTRLDAIARALPGSGLSNAAQAQLRVEHEDLSRLELAYARLTISTDDRSYLDRRLADLELRARVRR